MTKTSLLREAIFQNRLWKKFVYVQIHSDFSNLRMSYYILIQLINSAYNKEAWKTLLSQRKKFWSKRLTQAASLQTDYNLNFFQ